MAPLLRGRRLPCWSSGATQRVYSSKPAARSRRRGPRPPGDRAHPRRLARTHRWHRPGASATAAAAHCIRRQHVLHRDPVAVRKRSAAGRRDGRRDGSAHPAAGCDEVAQGRKRSRDSRASRPRARWGRAARRAAASARCPSVGGFAVVVHPDRVGCTAERSPRRPAPSSGRRTPRWSAPGSTARSTPAMAPYSGAPAVTSVPQTGRGSPRKVPARCAPCSGDDGRRPCPSRCVPLERLHVARPADRTRTARAPGVGKAFEIGWRPAAGRRSGRARRRSRRGSPLHPGDLEAGWDRLSSATIGAVHGVEAGPQTGEPAPRVHTPFHAAQPRSIRGSRRRRPRPSLFGTHRGTSRPGRCAGRDRSRRRPDGLPPRPPRRARRSAHALRVTRALRREHARPARLDVPGRGALVPGASEAEAQSRPP
jgi:hypothetical protein